MNTLINFLLEEYVAGLYFYRIFIVSEMVCCHLLEMTDYVTQIKQLKLKTKKKGKKESG